MVLFKLPLKLSTYCTSVEVWGDNVGCGGDDVGCGMMKWGAGVTMWVRSDDVALKPGTGQRHRVAEARMFKEDNEYWAGGWSKDLPRPGGSRLL